MKKKENKKKINLVDQANGYFDDYLKPRVKSYKAQHIANEDENEYVEAVVEYDGYNAHFRIDITLDCADSLILYFSYPNCEMEFSIDDLFNTLEINDFNEYSFDFGEEDSCKNVGQAFDDAFEFLNKYDYDIRKAGESANLSYMIQLHNEDEKYYKNMKVSKIIKLSLLEAKMFKTKKEKDKNAFLNYTDKLSAEIGLDNSTKRLVNYLKQGYDIPDVKNDSSNDYDSKFGKKTVLSYMICDIIGLVVCAMMVLGDRIIMSGKGIVLGDDILSIIIGIGIPGFILGYLLTRLFATKIMIALMPNEEKDAIIGYRKKRFDDLNFFEKIFSKYLAPVLAIIVFLILTMFSMSSVCVTENGIIDHSMFSNNEYAYEEVDVFLEKGYYEDGEYYEYDYPYYTFVTDDGNSISTGEIRNDEDVKYLEEQFAKRNINPLILNEDSEELKEKE